MSTQTKNTDNTRGASAANLDLDTYIRRYMKRAAVMPYDEWLRSQWDANGDGIKQDSEKKAYNQIQKEDKNQQQGRYADYVSGVKKLNDAEERRLKIEWETARGYAQAGENATYTDGFTKQEFNTVAAEKQDLAQQQSSFIFSQNMKMYVLIAAVVLGAIFILKK